MKEIDKNQKLPESEQMLASVISNYPGIIWSVNKDRVITLFGGVYCEKMGITTDFLEGKNLESARKKNRHSDILEKIEETFKGEAQDWISDIDGKKIRVRIAPIRDKDGQISAVVGSLDDVTEMVGLQDELAISAARLKAVVTNYPGAICSADKDLNITIFDGLLVPRLVDKDLFFEGQDLHVALQKDEFKHILVKLYDTFTKGAQDWSFEANGKALHMTTTPIHDENGEVSSLVAKIDDITEMTKIQKQLETALKQAEEAVRDSEAAELTTSAMFNSNPHMNVLFDSDFKVIDCNPASVKFFGFDTKENLFDGFVERMVKSIPEYQPDGHKSIPLSERLITAVKEGSVKFETELLMDNVKWNLDVEFKKIPYEGSFAIVGYVYDMTAIRARETELARVYELNKAHLKELNLALIEAEAANKAKTSFLSTMSHEIRTPMNAILGITEIQLQNDDTEPDIHEAFEKIYASGDLLLGIINDILDLSKIEAGKMELNISRYDLSSLISDTAQINMMRVGSKPIEFELQIDENIPFAVLGDELRVKQILNNLLSNAFKYTTEGTVKMSVSSEGGEDENTVALICAISDTGQGMTKEQVAKLFDEYSRFNQETNRSTEGTGLGMSITRNLVYLMGGRIFIDSEKGKGSVFTVHLPQGKVTSDTLGKELVENLKNFRTSSRAQMKRVQITRDPMPYGKVLIVDDVETNIYVAKGLLSPYKLKIDSAVSGFAAVEKIKSGSVYDIIFMDHMMPEMDGIETAKVIRGMGYTHSIVALTANAVAGQADIFLKNGFDDFISKPIDVRQLNSVLNKLVRDKQSPELIARAQKQAETKDGQSDDDESQSGIDPMFAEVFVRDASKALDILEQIEAENDYTNKEALQSYIINVHGMKSALANIGKMDLSAAALKLEAAARDGLLKMVESETPAFLRALRAYAEEIAPQHKTAVASEDEDKAFLREKLLAIKEACEYYDRNAADEELAKLRGKPWSPQTGELLRGISEQLLHGDFDEIIEAINAFTDAPQP